MREDAIPRGLARAKRGLAKKFADQHWYRGVAIAPSSSGLVLRLSIDPNFEPADDLIPSSYYGYPVEVLRIAGYQLR